jgi:hypothetical protein
MGRVTKKRLAEIKGNSFVAARILSSGETLSLPSGNLGKGQKWANAARSLGGLPISKGAGFCWIYNSVLCSYQKSGGTGYIERCAGCSEFIRAEHEEAEEDEATAREIDEAFRRLHAGLPQ